MALSIRFVYSGSRATRERRSKYLPLTELAVVVARKHLTQDMDQGTDSTSSLAEPLLENDKDRLRTSSLGPEEKNDDEHQLEQDSHDIPSLLENENDVEEDDDDHPTWRGLLFFKFLYFLNGLSASTWGRFGVIFYNDVCHLEPEQIGILQGLAPWVSFLCMPLWGVVADRWWHSRKRVYLVTKALNTLSLVSLAWVPRGQHPFGAVLACVMAMSIFRSSGILDAYVLDYLGDQNKTQYGSIRLYTAISWGLGAVLMGWLTDHWGDDENFDINFILYGTMMTTMILLVALGLPLRSKSEQARYESHLQVHHDDDNGTSNNHHHPPLETLVQALVRWPVFFWWMQVIMIGTGMALVDSFLFVYLQNDLQASTQLCGLAVGITVLWELPIFHYSQTLLRTMGHDVLFATSMLAYIVRAFGYTWLTPSTVQWVLALEVLHGITFACMWIASIDFSATVAPPEWSTTVQTILSASFACFGSVVGSVLGGWVMQTYSAVVLYRGMGFILTAVLLLHVFVWLGCGRGHDAFLNSLQTQNDHMDAHEIVDDNHPGDSTEGVGVESQNRTESSKESEAGDSP